MSIFAKGFFTILGVSIVVFLAAIPLALRKIPRNMVYGFRTRATMADDAIWLEANSHFGRGLIVASLCGAFLAYLLYRFEPLSPAAFLPVSILVLAVPSLLAAVSTARHVRLQTKPSRNPREPKP